MELSAARRPATIRDDDLEESLGALLYEQIER